MSNQLLTISMITQESLRVLKGNLVFARNVNRGYNDEFGRSGAKIGQTLNIRKPARYIGRSGPTVGIEAQTETYVPLVLTEQEGVDLAWTTAEQTLSIDAFSDRIIVPAMAHLANKIDAYCASQVRKIYNQVGTPGTSIGSLTSNEAIKLVLAAGSKLDDYLAPRDGQRSLILDPASQAALAASATTLFNPASDISKQYRSGQVTEALGFGVYMDQNMVSGSVDAPIYAGTPKVNGAGQSGSTLVTDGWSSGASSLPEGTVFTIDGVYAVNPQSKITLRSLQQFVVTANVADVGGAMSISISPAIVTTGAFKNVSAGPADNANVVVAAASGQATQFSAAFHKDAFVLGFAELALPGGTIMASRATDPDTGVSIRLVQQYDVKTDRLITRFDTLFGANTLYEQLCTRICV